MFWLHDIKYILPIMIQKILSFVGLVVLLLVISELIGLGYLWYGLKTYDDYWRGRANQPGEFLYVALGDSAAQAVGASKPANGYVGLLAAKIEQTTGRKVRVVNLSVSGAKIEDALREQVPHLANYKIDLVTAEIGANDMANYNPEAFAKSYETFLQALPPGRSVVSNMPYFGGRANTTRNAQDANKTIAKLTSRYAIPTAQLYEGLSTQQSPLIYASDFFHPNNRGYRIWYEAFWPQVEAIAKQ
jgi:acyl-CoA thioesterase-1